MCVHVHSGMLFSVLCYVAFSMLQKRWLYSSLYIVDVFITMVTKYTSVDTVILVVIIILRFILSVRLSVRNGSSPEVA